MNHFHFYALLTIITTLIYSGDIVAQSVSEPGTSQSPSGATVNTSGPTQQQSSKAPSDAAESEISGSEAAMKDINISPAYFLRHDAYRYAEEFRQKSRDEVISLKRVVDLYGDRSPETKDRYVEIQDEYRKGMQFYYMGQYESAIQSLEKARRDAKKLYQTFADLYDKDTREILDDCSSSMVEKDISMSYSGGQGSGSASAELMKYQLKLRMAFQQLGAAQKSARDENYQAALEHYRLAKLHSINILLDLAEDMNAKKELSKKYRIDLIDAYGVQSPPEAN